EKALAHSGLMGDVCVRVAVRIRPLLAKEVLQQHEVCVRVVPNSAQVVLGSDRLFSFDHAFGPTASQDEVYQSGVLPLVESLLDGYNATVFCYGQTGSGKTYTLGGSFSCCPHPPGQHLLPQQQEPLFKVYPHFQTLSG
uniref:Kinesin motor domain-containing protein n=1 Tax=Nothobranchius furzeri TaxID=105023 RepID=A0A8C6MGN5_NOTFU